MSVPVEHVEVVTRTALDRLCDPHSIAVIGASADPAKRGYQAIRALLDAKYPYPIYPVNLRGDEVLGLPAYCAVGELPQGIDVALVALPGRLAAGVISELGAVGVACAVVLANGFAESGSDGAALEAELADAAALAGVRIVGPNTSGVLNTGSGANLVGVPDVPAGPVSVVTQSGNMLLSLLADNRALHGPGFHTYIGLGNQIDVSYQDCVTHLAGDPGTRAIAIHSEGIRDGRAFLVAAAHASRQCPIVLLRGGRSDVGRRSALSHTGSVAGPDDVAQAVLTQAGVELVERSDELAAVAGALATASPMPAGRAVAVLADGGGHATLAVDALVAAGVPIATLSDESRTALRALLGPASSVSNPVDVAGATDADPARFTAAAKILLDDPAVGLVLITGLYGGYHLRFDARLAAAEDETSSALVDVAGSRGLPVIVHSCYAVDLPENHRILRSGGIPVLASLDHATRAVAALYRRGRRLATAHLRSNLRVPVASPRSGVKDTATVTLDEPMARTLLSAVGIDTGPWRLATTPREAALAVADFDGPCAMKVMCAQVTHKSDVGGVRLDVTVANATQAWTQITDAVHAHLPEARVDGVVITPMARPGVELLVGATVDPIFGPIVAFGAGGVLVEAVRDVSFRAAPFTHREALEMIDETAISRALNGYRHLPPVNRAMLAGLLVRVGTFAANTPDLAELDLNPVIANPTGIHPVDVRVALIT